MCNVQVIEPWHVAARTTVQRFVPESRPLRVLAGVGAGLASTAISASAVWLAFTVDLGFDSASFVTARARDMLVRATGATLEAVVGSGAADAVRANGSMAMAAGAVAIVAAVGASAFGFRALATASRQRGS
jgi:hypothetical protein